jgi:hypothetical protein
MMSGQDGDDRFEARRQRSPRVRRQLKVRFGTGSPDALGATTNLSATGLKITAAEIHPEGTRLRLEVRLPNGGVARVRGHVAWARARPAGILGAKGAMGVQVVDADEAFGEYVQRDPTLR